MRTQNFLSGMKNSAINFALETYGTQLSDTVKSRYGFQINIDVAEKAISLANDWLKKYDKKHGKFVERVAHYKKQNPDIQDINDFIEKIFPEKKLNEENHLDEDEDWNVYLLKL